MCDWIICIRNHFEVKTSLRSREQKRLRTKRMVVWSRGLSWLTGCGQNRLVNLPPTRAGGVRCSVKPAWRGALHSRNYELQAFARSPLPNSSLGTGESANSTHTRPTGHL
uniref:Uncharacterized protein n=1 Tax=Kalanchoe fedtschenkoi TaxID=63787 RepID=A0A7N0U8E8_KALFE